MSLFMRDKPKLSKMAQDKFMRRKKLVEFQRKKRVIDRVNGNAEERNAEDLVRN
ncbi:hypothetical protein IMZ31_17115 [Pontibacillus sp. ALD_SL1]|uniref:hypothetical protein n=1 Tax=Pontibacillus sp. ALD_SL1 TaxID=2777185 RepID=UPI001A97B642|nr:hypothetical protein [Pontibacillus sp. ALD_SL1]QSS99762.1 hypothetical protein IMZ31_17115 [Pontibacillus sp. ALD_SL1]